MRRASPLSWQTGLLALSIALPVWFLSDVYEASQSALPHPLSSDRPPVPSGAASTLAEPPRLLAAEVDALEGGVRLAEALTGRSGPLGPRLVEGFRTFPGHPRLARAAPADGLARDTVVPPAPRWLAATGVMLAPVPEATANGRRASFLAALVAALSLSLVLRSLTGPSWPLIGALGLLAAPVWAALTGFGYGATAMLSTGLLLLGLVGLAPPRPPPAGTVAPGGVVSSRGHRALAAVMACAVGLALALGTHPLAVALLPLPLLARPTLGGPGREVPWGHILAPALAVLLLVALWPTAQVRPGAAILAWLLSPGMSPEPATVGHFGSEVVRHLLAAFPWPLLGLAGYGLLAPSDGDPRVGAAGGVLGTLLLVGFAAGGLAGDRLDLLPMLVPPLVVLAGVGLERLLARSPTRRRGLVAVLAGASLASSLAGPDRAVLDAGRGVVTADGPEAELVRQVARDHLEWRGE